MKKWDSQSTWKSRLFAAAAVAAASASIGVTAASGSRSTTSTTTVTTTASTFVVCPVLSISSSSSSISLSDRQRCRRDRKKGPPPVFLPSKNVSSSSLSLNAEKKLFDEHDNNHRQQLPSPSTITDDQSIETDNNSLPPLSESDALRILRRAGSSSFCRTPLDVLHILRRASNTNLNNNFPWQKDTKLDEGAPKAEEISKENYFHSYSPTMVDDAVDGITPNIAAAALRLLCSPPFLHVPSSSSSSAAKSSANASSFSKRGRYYRWGIRSERLNRHERIDDDTIKSTQSTTKPTTTTTARLQAETNAYELMMSQLLKKMNVNMEILLLENHSTGTSDGVRGGGASTWVVPVLLPRRDCDVDDTMRENAMDPNALTDLLHASSNLAIVLAGSDGAGIGISSSGKGSIGRDGGGGMIEGHLLTNISPSEQGSIMDLFASVIGHISRNDLSISEFVRIVGPRRLVRDVVRPMADIETSRRKITSKHAEGGGEEWLRKNGRNLSLPMDRLLAIVSSYLALPHSLEQLTATDLSDTLWCFTKLTDPHTLHFIVDSNTNDDATLLLQRQITMPQRKLLRAFMKRLRKYPIRSAAGGRDLVRAMWSAARLIRQWEDGEGVLQQSKVSSSSLHSGRAQMENRLLPLPIRLPGEEVDDEWDSIETNLKEIEVEVDQSQPSSSLGDLPTSILRKEATIMFHTLINEIVHPPNFPRRNEESSHGIPTIAKDGIKLHSIDLGQVADILQAATDLRISGKDMKSALVSILQHLTGSDPTSRNDLLSRCRSCRDISRVLFSLQRLRVGTGIFDDGCSESLESRSVMLLGERFLDIVNLHKGHRSNCCDGKTLAIILRSGVMMFRETNPATTAMLDAATILILNGVNERWKVEDWSYSPFLSSCNDFEVSSFLFAFAMARRFDQELFTSLTDQMTEDILDSCTASSASRTMWSCAMLLSLDGAGTAMNTYKLIDLFHQISPLLLSSSLSPTYVSGAMWAMAKSEYVVDKGIFDHLAQSAASDEMMQRSNTRIVSQALWSCAKMVAFETPGTNNLDADATLDFPPYINACYKYIRFIVENRNRISPKQLSRSIWAIGRLRLSDAILIQEMGDIAMLQSHAFDSRDIANVVWGLSKLNYERPEAVLRLAKQVVTFQTNELTAREASMILFALGKLQIHDKDVFKSLYSSISSSPQSSAARLIPFSSNSFLIW